MREGWIETTLGEIAEIQMGQSPDGSTYNKEGIGLPFMQGSAEFGEQYPKPEKWCSEPKKIAEIGDLLLSVRAPVGDTNFADQRIAVGRGLSVIRAKSSLSDTRFIRMFIQLNINEMISNSGSGMFSSITGQNLRNFSFLLPPLPDQKRIVDLISSVDSYIEALEQQAESARKSRSAVLHEMLSAGGEGWTETTLGKVSSCAGGSAFPVRHQGNNEGIPFIKVSDMNLPGNELIIHFASNYISEEKAAKLKVRVWPKDTVIFPKVGAALLTNKRRILSESTIFDNNIMGLVSGDQLNPNFLLYFMQTIDMNDYVQNGALPSISNEIVKAIDILLPPRLEQKRIVDLISTMDDEISATEKLINETKQLRSGLLSDLLSGDHEIPESYDKVMGAA